jgi:hypothetical protein
MYLDSREGTLKVSRRLKEFRALHGPATKVLLSTLLMVCQVGHADTSLKDQCPGAAAWNEQHREYSIDAMTHRDNARTLLEPELLSELRRRVAADQDARRLWISRPADAAAAHQVDSADNSNIVWLRKLVKAQGYPTAEQVGATGVHLAWLLLQHSDQDPEFRASLVPTLVEQYKSGELSPTDLARVMDRSLKAAGRPQRFGTQFDWLSGHFKLPSKTVLLEINKNRAEIGLMPLEDYACAMNRRLAE